MNQTILIKSLILCAFLCIISCDKLENEYYDTPISKEVMSGAVTEDGDSCVDFGWSPDGNTIVYTDGVSFVKKVALSSGYISTLARRTRGGFFEYFSPRITDEAVYYGRKWMGSQPGLPRGAICKISLPDTSAKILQQFDASIAMNMIISDDSKKIACATNDSLLVFDTSGIVLHRISTNLHDVPFCFSQDNATLYIASNFPFFKGLTSFSLIDSSTAAIISGMPNEAGWSVSADSNGVRILIETASTFVLRNLSNGTSKVLWTFTRPQSQFFNSYVNFAVYSDRTNCLGFGLSIPTAPYDDCKCTVDIWNAYSIDIAAQSETASNTTRHPITRGAFSSDGRKLAFIAGGRIFVK
jgi:hypothetical protein